MSDENGFVRSNIQHLVDALQITSRKALAEAAGVSESNIGQLVRGASKGMRPAHLVRAAQHLGVTTEQLVTVDLRNEPHAGLGSAPRDDRHIRALTDRIRTAWADGRIGVRQIDYLDSTLTILLATTSDSGAP